MDVSLKPGKYVIAVSGGVDSVSLLDLLAQRPGLNLIIAHFDHGIRRNSAKDATWVQELAAKYRLSFELGNGNLGPETSEDAARKARYRFLENIKIKHNADSIITAHHQDDLIETALLNSLRGTGTAGLSSIANNPNVLRPFLNVSKSEILDYAKKNKLEWLEDETNNQDKYLRNQLRKLLNKNLTTANRQELLNHLVSVKETEDEIKMLVDQLSSSIRDDTGKIDRAEFSTLPMSVANQMLLSWLKQNGISDLDRPTVERLSLAIKTAQPTTKHNIKGGWHLAVDKQSAQITNTFGKD